MYVFFQAIDQGVKKDIKVKVVGTVTTDDTEKSSVKSHFQWRLSCTILNTILTIWFKAKHKSRERLSYWFDIANHLIIYSGM